MHWTHQPLDAAALILVIATGTFTIAGTVVGGIIQYFTSLARLEAERKQHLQDVRRDKLEELSHMVEELRFAMIQEALQARLGVVMPIDLEKVSTTRATTLIQFYAPSLVPKMGELVRCMENVGEANRQLRFQGSQPNLTKQLDGEVNELLKCCIELQQEIAELGRKTIPGVLE